MRSLCAVEIHTHCVELLQRMLARPSLCRKSSGSMLQFLDFAVASPQPPPIHAFAFPHAAVNATSSQPASLPSQQVLPEETIGVDRENIAMIGSAGLS